MKLLGTDAVDLPAAVDLIPRPLLQRQVENYQAWTTYVHAVYMHAHVILLSSS